MGNLQPSRTDVTVCQDFSGGKFTVKNIQNGITYYQGVFPGAARSAKESEASTTSSLVSPSAFPLGCSSSPALTESVSSSRPLLVFFSWLGAQPRGVAKYRDLYLARGMDVLLIQSRAVHFLWPRWGLNYGAEVLKVLEEPPFSERPVLVHATSIGGFTFSQTLTHVAQRPKKHAALAQRVIGHIYDSLVVGTLEHMAIGLGRTLVPRFQSLVKNVALLYFWLFKSHTADLYNSSIQVFHNSPVTAPALFFFCENDAMCDPVALETLMDHWRKRGVDVQSRKWKESVHAAHMRCHSEDYHSSLETFLKSLSSSS